MFQFKFIFVFPPFYLLLSPTHSGEICWKQIQTIKQFPPTSMQLMYRKCNINPQQKQNHQKRHASIFPLLWRGHSILSLHLHLPNTNKHIYVCTHRNNHVLPAYQRAIRSSLCIRPCNRHHWTMQLNNQPTWTTTQPIEHAPTRRCVCSKRERTMAPRSWVLPIWVECFLCYALAVCLPAYTAYWSGFVMFMEQRVATRYTCGNTYIRYKSALRLLEKNSICVSY